MKCQLSSKVVNKDGKQYTNLILKTPKGTSVEIRLAFPNRKLVYKICKEIEEDGK